MIRLPWLKQALITYFSLNKPESWKKGDKKVFDEMKMEGQHKEIKKFFFFFSRKVRIWGRVHILLAVVFLCYFFVKDRFSRFFCNKIHDKNRFVPTPKIASSKTQFSSIQKLFAACLLSIFPNFFFFISPLRFQIFTYIRKSKVSKIWIIETKKCTSKDWLWHLINNRWRRSWIL